MQLTETLINECKASEMYQTLLKENTFSIDNTTFVSHTTCPMKGIIERVLRRKPTKMATPLIFGEAFHKALELLALGETEEKALASALAIARDQKLDFADDVKRNSFTLEQMLKFYFMDEEMLSPEDRAEVLKIRDKLMIEQSFSLPLGKVELNIKGEVREIKIYWTGKLDALVFRLGIWVRDHKTTSVMGEKFAKDKERSDQMLGYSWAAFQILKVFGLESKFKGVEINAIAMRKRGYERRFFRIPYTVYQLQEWQEETLIAVKEILTRVIGILETGVVIPNRNSCVGKYGACPHFDLCETPALAKEKTLLNSGFYEADTWSPLTEDENDNSSQGM